MFIKSPSSTVLIILQKCNTCQHIFAWFINLFWFGNLKCKARRYIRYTSCKAKRYTPIYTATFWTWLRCMKCLGRSCDISLRIDYLWTVCRNVAVFFSDEGMRIYLSCQQQNYIEVCVRIFWEYLCFTKWREHLDVVFGKWWSVSNVDDIIKTHIQENRFHGNRSVHPQKLPTT